MNHSGAVIIHLTSSRTGQKPPAGSFSKSEHKLHSSIISASWKRIFDDQNKRHTANKITRDETRKKAKGHIRPDRIRSVDIGKEMRIQPVQNKTDNHRQNLINENKE
jgi:hypothetical protein